MIFLEMPMQDECGIYQFGTIIVACFSHAAAPLLEGLRRRIEQSFLNRPQPLQPPSLAA